MPVHKNEKKNSTFFKKINQIFENFNKKLKIFEIFLSPKIENFQNFFLVPKTYFLLPQGPN